MVAACERFLRALEFDASQHVGLRVQMANRRYHDRAEIVNRVQEHVSEMPDFMLDIARHREVYDEDRSVFARLDAITRSDSCCTRMHFAAERLDFGRASFLGLYRYGAVQDSVRQQTTRHSENHFANSWDAR
jgi:hypothetical protein